MIDLEVSQVSVEPSRVAPREVGPTGVGAVREVDDAAFAAWYGKLDGLRYAGQQYACGISGLAGGGCYSEDGTPATAPVSATSP